MNRSSGRRRFLAGRMRPPRSGHSDFQEGRLTVGFIQQHPELFVFAKRRDRATRMLRYLANVSVNGNPDVQVKKNKRQFDVPQIPDYNKFV